MTAMKNPIIDAKVKFSPMIEKEFNKSRVLVPVDCEWTEADVDEITDVVRCDLESMFGRKFNNEDFEITNMDELMEEV
jgi:hypothetical protein